jgi:hypothetical protein
MSKESTRAAFARATGHLLLNLSPEREASLTAYEKSDERIRMEQQLKQEPVDRKDGED